MNFDEMLRRVLDEARVAGVPVSADIHSQVRLNARAKKRYGCCRRQGNAYVIELSAVLQNAAEKDVRAVLAHEVLHTCRGCMNHGEAWKRYAARMTERYGYALCRTGDIAGVPKPSAPPVRYAVQCTGCGAMFLRTRLSKLVLHPERYRCRCGGALRRQTL